jgi:hypothetical protein
VRRDVGELDGGEPSSSDAVVPSKVSVLLGAIAASLVLPEAEVFQRFGIRQIKVPAKWAAALARPIWIGD